MARYNDDIEYMWQLQDDLQREREEAIALDEFNMWNAMFDDDEGYMSAE